MGKEIAVFNYVLPVWFIIAHVNGEPLDNEDEQILSEDFYDTLAELVTDNSAKRYTIETPKDIEEAKYFFTFNDVCNLNGQVCACTVHLF